VRNELRRIRARKCESGWHQLKASEILCRPATWGSGANFQPEPGAGESTTAVENILCGISAKDPEPRGFISYRVAQILNPMKTLEDEALQTSHAEGHVGAHGVDQYLKAWTLESLTKRPQNVRIWNYESNMANCSMEAPQMGLTGSTENRAVVCWGKSASTADRKSLNRQTEKTSVCPGMPP
ncbi:hypothetical protein L3Q82_009652, partial [Scortum barcoo]